MGTDAANNKSSAESELWGAIAAFERILEVMPTDRLALETLSDAYEQIGQLSKASAYLLRLIDVIVNEGDKEAAPLFLEKITAYGDDPSFAGARQKLSNLLNKEAAKTVKPVINMPTQPAPKKAFDISREMSLAWDLMQDGMLTSDEYAAVVHDLSENSSKRIDVPVSVLHALHDRGFKGLDKMMVHLSRQSGRPILTLSCFELNKDAYSLLPLDYMRRRGAIPFELMGADILVAVLNPHDKELQKEVSEATGRRCHFYLVGATDYDAALTNIKKALAEPTLVAV